MLMTAHLQIDARTLFTAIKSLSCNTALRTATQSKEFSEERSQQENCQQMMWTVGADERETVES